MRVMTTLKSTAFGAALALAGIQSGLAQTTTLNVAVPRRCFRNTTRWRSARASSRKFATFQDWVEVSHIYRHRPGAAESGQPPADVAILAITLGASLLRWLAGLDEDRPADCQGSIAAGLHRADVS